MTPLVIPGVRVEAKFDVVPPPPSATGILGLVGVVDRPAGELVGVTSTSEIAEVLGPGTLHSMPEIAEALRNGASEVVVSAVDAAAAGTAVALLKDRDGEDVVELRARAQGPWADDLAVQVDEVLGPDGRSVRSVDISVFDGGTLVESHRNLIVDPSIPARDLYRVINRDSTRLVALDGALKATEPTGLSDLGAFVDHDPAAAFKILTAGTGVPSLRLTAKSLGDEGNSTSVEVVRGQMAALILDVANKPALRVTSSSTPAATAGTITVAAGVPGTVNIAIATTVAGAPKTESYSNLGTVGAIVTALSSSDLVSAEPVAGGDLPVAGATELAATATVIVRPAGADERAVENRLTVTEVADALTANPFVDAATVAGYAPGPLDSASGFLSGGRGAAPVVRLMAPAGDVAEITAAEGKDPKGWKLVLVQSAGGGFHLTLNDGGGNRLERHEDLTMDPDSDRYLPAALQAGSQLLVASDLAVRSKTVVLPRSTNGRIPMSASAPPTTAAFQAAVDALAADSRIDLLAASVQSHTSPGLDVTQVHSALRAFADGTADRGVPAIAFGSVAPESDRVNEILDEANDARSSRFVLCAPHGTHAAVAGLIGRLAVQQSPTFKTVPTLSVRPGQFRESELRRLVDPVGGNVLVVQKHPSRGIIVVKGVATNGWQINVTRTADSAVREIKKIAEGFIGELNDEPSRTALGQQVTQYLLRLERDGAIVPSADGEDPAFQSRVYATPLDFAQGIVRIDIAIRPVRAIDYVYATIRVKAL